MKIHFTNIFSATFDVITYQDLIVVDDWDIHTFNWELIHLLVPLRAYILRVFAYMVILT